MVWVPGCQMSYAHDRQIPCWNCKNEVFINFYIFTTLNISFFDLHKKWNGVQGSSWVTYQVWSHRWRNHGRYATIKMTPWKFCSGFFTTTMNVFCLFSPMNQISITQLMKICLSCGVEILTDKWGDDESSWKPCRTLSNP